MSGGWSLAWRSGSAAELHQAAPDPINGPHRPSRQVTVMEASGPAVVLGSAQPEAHLDRARAAAAGVAVARRRSGGAAVLVGTGEVLWVDLVIPAGDSLWSADVARAAWWVGDVWVRALRAVRRDTAEVWRQGMVRSPWSDRICFAGLAPGEVRVGERKAVGLSQRRTRHGALFQCAALLVWDPVPLLAVLDLTDADRRRGAVELGAMAIGTGGAGGRRRLLAAFLDELEGTPLSGS